MSFESILKTFLPIVVLLSFTGCFLSSPEQPLPTPPPSTTLVDPPVVISFEITPAEIVSGESATLTWKVTGATNTEINPDIGNVANSGTLTVLPIERTVYRITAINSGGTDSKTAVIVVNMNLKAKPICQLIKCNSKHFI